MKYRVYPWKQLSHEHLAAWCELQRAEGAFDSPYFRPEYHQLANEVGRPVMVGVLESGDAPVGFFPYEQGAFGTALPVGLRLSDFHGVIAPAHVDWSARELLAACGLKRFLFDHLPVAQTQFLSGDEIIADSPLIDTSTGFESYTEAIKARGGKELGKLATKRGKAERQVGPFEFCFHDPRPKTIEACFTWKEQQYLRTAAMNVLQTAWVREFLTRIAQFDSPHFAGVVSTVSVHGQIAAVHLGMRSTTVLHQWFPAHDTDHPAVRFSPGLQLLVHEIEHACQLGLKRIDLGKGDQDYKLHLATGASQVAEGTYGVKALSRSVFDSLRGARSWVRQAAESAGLNRPVRWYRSMRDWLTMR